MIIVEVERGHVNYGLSVSWGDSDEIKKYTQVMS